MQLTCNNQVCYLVNNATLNQSLRDDESFCRKQIQAVTASDCLCLETARRVAAVSSRTSLNVHDALRCLQDPEAGRQTTPLTCSRKSQGRKELGQRSVSRRFRTLGKGPRHESPQPNVTLVMNDGVFEATTPYLDHLSAPSKTCKDVEYQTASLSHLSQQDNGVWMLVSVSWPPCHGPGASLEVRRSVAGPRTSMYSDISMRTSERSSSNSSSASAWQARPYHWLGPGRRSCPEACLICAPARERRTAAATANSAQP